VVATESLAGDVEQLPEQQRDETDAGERSDGDAGISKTGVGRRLGLP
jgi:hypothetical protein